MKPFAPPFTVRIMATPKAFPELGAIEIFRTKNVHGLHPHERRLYIEPLLRDWRVREERPYNRQKACGGPGR